MTTPTPSGDKLPLANSALAGREMSADIIPLHRGVRPIDLRIVDPEFDHYSSADPDQAYADALLDEIGEGVVWLAWGGIAALFLIVLVLS